MFCHKYNGILVFWVWIVTSLTKYWFWALGRRPPEPLIRAGAGAGCGDPGTWRLVFCHKSNEILVLAFCFVTSIMEYWYFGSELLQV